MATYAIGDLQGCFDEFINLLEKIHFNPPEDTLWFVGDIINRGPKSLHCLRFIKGLKKNAIMVLGNHELHLLAIVYGSAAKKPYDTLDDILAAPEKNELIEWLRQQPLLHHDNKLGYTLVHAGIFPEWDLTQAQHYANELETLLRGPDHIPFFQNMYGNYPDHWDENLKDHDRLRFILNAFTRMRLCGPGDKLNLKKKGPPSDAPENYLPWFKVPNRRNKDINIIFGHWAALAGETGEPNAFALDTGCVWGGLLTTMRLEDGKLFSVPSKQPKAIKPYPLATLHPINKNKQE